MFGSDVAPGQLDEAAVWAGLARFAALPGWLAAGRQPECVGAALSRHVPEFAAGDLTLRGCEARRLRLKGSDGWVGQYRLTVEGPRPGQRRDVALAGRLHPPGAPEPAPSADAAAFGTAAWRGYLPELRLELWAQGPDTQLPALPGLTDPEQARKLLERSIRAGAPAYRDIRIQACEPRVARYKPGSRCTIVYRLEYPPDLADGRGWPELVVAKTHRGEKGRNAYAGMRALWDSPLRAGDVVAIAEPLAYLPELKVLVQGPVREERTLRALCRAALRTGTPVALAELEDYVRKTAVGLAELHRSAVGYGEPVTWADELGELQARAGRLAAAVPGLASAATPLLARLAALAAEHPADPPVPAHRSFRPAQVLLDRGRVGFIDFDGLCQAEPALDLALFRATLKEWGLKEALAGAGRAGPEARLAQLEGLCEMFLAAYETQAPVSRARVALWEALYLLAEVVSGWTKVRPERVGDSLLVLQHHLRVSGLLGPGTEPGTGLGAAAAP
jgi:Ser/Thr protein kinase RdoA (MazF antagonist)